MLRSMFSAISGLRAHQVMMDEIGNNIANVNTVGYKSGRVNFQDILSQTFRGASAPQGGLGSINPAQVRGPRLRTEGISSVVVASLKSWLGMTLNNSFRSNFPLPSIHKKQ